MEDYEKKYKQALGWMQSLNNGLHGKTKEEAEHFFPELKESEDEKIRKALIGFLKSPFVNENITDEKVIPWIAWLEKQGQEKHLSAPIDEQSDTCDTCDNDNDYTKNNEEKAKEICGKGNPCCNKLCQFCNLSFVIADVKQMAEWKDAQHAWHPIPKDKDGFYDDLQKNLYNELPIIVMNKYDDGLYPSFEYICKDNWCDAVSDLSKPSYQYYMKIQEIPTNQGEINEK